MTLKFIAIIRADGRVILIMWPVCLLKSEENWIYSVSSPVVSDSFPTALAYRPKGL